MDPRQFDSLILTNQGFNTLNNLANSNVVQGMAQQTLQSIQTMQTPTPTAPSFTPTGLCGVTSNPQSAPNNVCQHQFYAVVNGGQKGPFTLEQLKGLAIAEVINEDTLVWMQGMPEWVSLKICLSNLR